MDNISILMRSALARQSAGDTDGAIELYKKILSLQPDSIEALCNLGSVMHGKGLLAEAIDCYRNALAVAPGIPQLYYNMAGAQQASGQLDAASENLLQAITLKPDYPRHCSASACWRYSVTTTQQRFPVSGNCCPLYPATPTPSTGSVSA